MKSKCFSNWKYIGDPINTAKIFNDKDTDELIVLDVDATLQHREPSYDLISQLAAECFLPITYGGGVNSPQAAKRLVGCGVDKVALNSAIFSRPSLLREISDTIGSSSTVASIDVSSNNGSHGIRKNPNIELWNFVAQLESHGAGEILVQSEHEDGRRAGPDLELATKILAESRLPIVYAGGVASLDDATGLWRLGIDGVAAGAWFVFSGPNEAVLVNYPSRKKIDEAVRSVS